MSGYASGFEHDVFISYAQRDNQSGWITALEEQLRIRLEEVLGAAVSVWRDPRLDGLHKLDVVIEEAVRKSALFLVVVSPSYLNSEYCARELGWFLDETAGAGVSGSTRIARLRKTPLNAGTEEPSDLAANESLGFLFFDEKSSVEFEPGPGPAEGRFREEVKKAAGALARVLLAMQRRVPKSTQRVVFLAEAAAQLARERSRLRRELEDQGHRVVPDVSLLTDGALDEQRLQAALRQASHSVHLFGSSYGLIPEGSDVSLPREQFDRAALAGLPQTVWIKPDAQPEERQGLFLADVRERASAAAAGRGVELCETGFSAFQEALLEILIAPARSERPPAGDKLARSIYLLFHPEDVKSEQLRALRCALVNSGFPVELPVFEAPPGELRSIEEQRILQNDATIIYYGNARDYWVDQKRKFLINSLGRNQRGTNRCRAVYLSPPKTTLKDLAFGDYVGKGLPEVMGFMPLLVLGDCGPFSVEQLKPLIENMLQASASSSDA